MSTVVHGRAGVQLGCEAKATLAKASSEAGTPQPIRVPNRGSCLRYPKYHLIPRGSKYPIFKVSGSKNHTLNGIWDQSH